MALSERPAPAWIWSRPLDGAVAWAWAPFFVAGAVMPDRVEVILVAAFALSFAHQPLTLALVYGDPDRFSTRRRVFSWSPLVFAAAVALGMHLSLALVALVAGLWNAEHTLMQRFGLTRIYARRSGETDGAGLERAMLLSWLAAALVWVAADVRTPAHLRSVRLGSVNEASVTLLTDLRPWATALLWPTLVVVAALTLRWIAVEGGRGPTSSRAKQAYVVATAALFAAIFVQPVWGLAGFVGAHALEYLAVVEHSVSGPVRRADTRGALGRVLRRTGSRGLIAAYLVAVLVPYAALRVAGLYGFLLSFTLVVGGLHVFYDGLIWKLRSPQVARTVGAEPAATSLAGHWI